MPPNDNHKKTKQRLALAERIQQEGSEMLPCSRCDKRGLQCLVSPASRTCGECKRSNVKCDSSGHSVGEWEKLRREEERIARETRTAREAVIEIQSRLLRLEKQQSLLKKRGGEMLRRGLATLDELEAVEEQEKREAEEASVREQNAQPPDDLFTTTGLDLGADDLFGNVSPSFWAELGGSGGTPAESRG